MERVANQAMTADQIKANSVPARKRQSVVDPIHGLIELPIWLQKVLNEKAVRRMMFIRQLGLKAYIDFPGAIHTRYGHALGSMHVAKRVVELLVRREQAEGYSKTADILSANEDNLMAAAFFHDIGHGPFSHAVDFAMKQISGKTHENISAEILTARLKSIESYGISVEAVKQIIMKTHAFPFVSAIVNGPLDVDKLDYLLRDSHHVGYRYSFDLDHFVDTYKILGKDEQPEECELGIEDSEEAITTAEIFVLIWKSMYDLVYFARKSRIAEKMLEKAVLLSAENDSELKDYFTKVEKYSELHDELLLEKLKETSGSSQKLVERIWSGSVYSTTPTQELREGIFEMNEHFLDDLSKDESLVAHKLSDDLCSELDGERYDLICDIVKSREPKEIQLDRPINNEPIELKSVSDVVKAIKAKNLIMVYTNQESSKKFDEVLINKKLKELVSSWG